MNKYCILLVILISSLLFGQTPKNELNLLQQKWESFDYKEVIRISTSILTERSKLSSDDICEVLRLKAISHYILSEEPLAEMSFIEILKINFNYQLDPMKNSPKIINFFSDIKNNYLKNNPVKSETKESKNDTTSKLPERLSEFQKIVILDKSPYLFKSMIIPGWGQLSLNSGLKGYLLTTFSTASLLSMIYFINDSNKKEKAYLNETERNAIENKYEQFNSSYKIRNISIITFVGLWLYSQFDILFLSDYTGELTKNSIKTELNPQSSRITLSFRF